MDCEIEGMAESGEDDYIERVISCWAVLQLHDGHRVAGYLTEAVFAGVCYAKVRIVRTDGSEVGMVLFNAQATYSITPISEELAKGYGDTINPIDLRAVLGGNATVRSRKKS